MNPKDWLDLIREIGNWDAQTWTIFTFGLIAGGTLVFALMRWWTNPEPATPVSKTMVVFGDPSTKTTVACPNCDKRHRVFRPHHHLEQVVTCTRCGARIRVRRKART